MSVLGEMLTTGLTVVREEQLHTGEIATYRHGSGRGLEYRFTLLASTYVHDALACFDPSSRWFEVQSIEPVSPRSKRDFLRLATGIRRDIRNFLAWQESADGTWRFYGRGSGLEADLNTTACAATALLDLPLPAESDRDSQRLVPFRTSGGRYASPGSRMPEPSATGGLVANANALRYLALTGGPFEALMTTLLGDLDDGRTDVRVSTGRDAVICIHAFARAWHDGSLPDFSQIAGRTASWLAQSLEAEACEDPLETALAALSLHDLDVGRDALRARVRRVADTFAARRGWPFSIYDTEGYGSPALTTALAMAALGRQTGLDEGWAS